MEDVGSPSRSAGGEGRGFEFGLRGNIFEAIRESKAVINDAREIILEVRDLKRLKNVRVIVYPRCNSQTRSHLSFFIQKQKSLESFDSTSYMQYTLSIGRSGGNLTQVSKGEFVDQGVLFDVDSGYLVDNTITFHARVLVLDEWFRKGHYALRLGGFEVGEKAIGQPFLWFQKGHYALRLGGFARDFLEFLLRIAGMVSPSFRLGMFKKMVRFGGKELVFLVPPSLTIQNGEFRSCHMEEYLYSNIEKVLGLHEVMAAIEEEDEQAEQRREEENGQATEEEEEIIVYTGSSGVGGGGEVPTASVVVLPNELVVLEVLTRLPAKSLMRFKCVSNLWRSTISHDPSFSKIHCAKRHSPLCAGTGGFFITYPDSDDSIRCFYATGMDLVPHQFTTATASNSCKSSIKFNGATDVVNGLFCLYAGNRSWLCNVSTREIKELPFSSDLEKAVFFSYFLGFASTSKEYKLFKLCLLPFSNEFVGCWRLLMCEILTLGKDATWRRPWHRHLVESMAVGLRFGRPSVYIDGFLCCWHRSGYTLTVFNFQDETFREISPPPKSSGSIYFEHGSLLLQFGGRFALVRGLQGRLANLNITIWVLELNKCKQGSYDWINCTIEVPCDFPVDGCSFAGNLPLPAGDQMLLTGLVEFIDNKSAVPVYSFDHTKGKFDKLVIGNFPSWSPSSQVASICEKDVNKFRVYYYEEDITPLRYLVIGDMDFSLTAASCTKKKKKKKKKKNKKKSSRTTTLSDSLPI